MYHLRKYSFSLIELLVVFSLLSFIVAVVGINIKETIAHTRFQTSYDHLVDKVRLAQNLANITQGGVKLILVQDNAEFFLSLDGESFPTVEIKQFVNKKEQLPGIASIHLSNQNQALPLELTFYPNGQCKTTALLASDVELVVTPSSSNRAVRTIALLVPPARQLVAEGIEVYPQQ